VKRKVIAIATALAIGVSITATSVASADHGGGKGKEQLSSFLSGLVSNGTITQSQADAIVKAAENAATAAKSLMKEKHDAFDSVITSTLGITLDNLKSRLKAGESLAAIAGDKKDALISALIAEINKQIDAAVTAGKITTTQATAQKAKTSERVTKMVNNVKEFGKKGHGKGLKGSAISFKAA
jgi:nickel-dependent lactate racemase